MKKIFEYSHLGGRQILQVDYPEIDKEINSIIESVNISAKTKVSNERSKKGKLLYSPKELNKRFREEFEVRGFHELKDTYTISIPGYDIEVKGAFKQIDFVKSRVLVEVQFGKYAFMFYDLAKFQYFFNEYKADVGVEIVPAYSLHKQMSTGVSYGEQLIYDIERLRRHFPAVPIKVILIDV
ncbi:MAG: BstYI [Firmicutes bacterium]|nr:BstYI [Bacillota bacterium]